MSRKAGVILSAMKWEIRHTKGGIPLEVNAPSITPGDLRAATSAGLMVRLEHARLLLLRGFDELLCLEGLNGVEHLPHQIETVRRVLRYFRGRVLLADEVGLGKTIEACLLLREYILRGLARRVLILVPSPLVSQWKDEMLFKFGLEFEVPSPSGPDAAFWQDTSRALCSIAYAKSKRNFEAVAASPWDLVIVDEAHHCKNRNTLNWKLVNALKRKHIFLLTATPVQNNLVELYNLLTLLEPGHLKTESDFKKTYVSRDNPLDPRNRERLKQLLGEVMVRNTRSRVNINLPQRFAQTFVVRPEAKEAELYRQLEDWLRSRSGGLARAAGAATEEEVCVDGGAPDDGAMENGLKDHSAPGGLLRMQVASLLLGAGSHPAALEAMLRKMAGKDTEAVSLLSLALAAGGPSAKEEKLLELLRAAKAGDKVLVFAGFRATLRRLALALDGAGIGYSVFSGAETAAQKDAAVERFKDHVPVMLCSESGGEGRNLQFANVVVNFDLPWNPMRIEQRIGRVHRIGQTREVFIFNLCVAGSIEERILRLLNDKIRMFELVVGEVGSILGNLDGEGEFESLVLDLWLSSGGGERLDAVFDELGSSLVNAQKEYLKTKELDENLFGDDYE